MITVVCGMTMAPTTVITRFPFPHTHTPTHTPRIPHTCCIVARYVRVQLDDGQYTECNRRNGPDFGRVFLRSYYTDITQNTCIQISMVTEILARDFETLTAITHLLITKYILKLAGICGFCSVNICT